MKAYKIYLTKSREVADLLQSHFYREMNSERDRILRIAFGTTTGEKEIPEIYHEDGLYYCLVERDSGRDSYEIVFA